MKDTWNQLEAVQHQRFRKNRFQRLAKARLYQQHTPESKLKHSGHTLPSNSCSARRQRCDRANVGSPRQPSWLLVVVDVDGERRRRGGKAGLYTPLHTVSLSDNKRLGFFFVYSTLRGIPIDTQATWPACGRTVQVETGKWQLASD
jgi:hypothetical protein